jgi:PAS domain S-box-containing protein
VPDLEPTRASEPGSSVHEDSLEDLYEDAPCGYLSCQPDGTVARVNRTFLDWTGLDREEVVGARRFVDLLTAGGRIYHETHFAPLLRMQGSVRAIALDIRRADGSLLPVLVNATQRADPAGRPLAVRITVFDATDRRTYEVELLDARRRAELSATRLRAVEQVVADLAAAGTSTAVREVVVRAGLEVFEADGSALWVVDPATTECTEVVATGTAGPARQVTGLVTASAATLAEGALVLAGDPAAAREAEPRAEVTSLAVVPVPARTGPDTLLVLAFDPPRALDPAEQGLLQTLGRQAGLALERADLTDDQRRVAQTLQRSMLPASLPEDPRLALSSCYRPAVDGLEVGGDWYDAFRLDQDRVAVVVGDVVGRGLRAAAAMGQLRSATRALAALDGGPARLLARLDGFVEGVEDAQTSTVVYAELDLRDGSLRYACAGHPPPVHVAAGGAELLWDGRSAPLGTHFGVTLRPEGRTVLPPGAFLALYTDGLVERRDRPLDQGIDQLALELSGSVRAPVVGLADTVVERILGRSRTGDDVCLLLVGRPDPTSFRREIPADRSLLSPLRQELAGWLLDRGVALDDVQAVVLSCSEAVANAIEHGYADDATGRVDVSAEVVDGAVRLRVHDHGRWRRAQAPGHRGRGIALMRRLMDAVEVDVGEGTRLDMERAPGGRS